MDTLTKNQQKFIRSLSLKKNRDTHGMFLAEGPKVVNELMGIFSCHLLAGTDAFLSGHSGMRAQTIVKASPEALSKASLLESPREVLAVFHKPHHTDICQFPPHPEHELVLMLDGIQDPGNLGTIIRLADWFDIRTVICSPHTADAFAPKVVQATMGSLARVRVAYTELTTYLKGLTNDIPVYGTFMEGDSIYQTALDNHGIIIMGNEGKGISPSLAALVSHRIGIPRLSANTENGNALKSAPNVPAGTVTESLNVAIATAITCAEFRRRQHSSASDHPTH